MAAIAGRMSERKHGPPKRWNGSKRASVKAPILEGKDFSQARNEQDGIGLYSLAELPILSPLRQPAPLLRLRSMKNPTFSRLPLCVGIASLWLAKVSHGEVLKSGESEFFETKVRPLLVKHCYECHSQDAEKIKGGLLLDTKEGWMAGGDSGDVIEPGNPGKSLLVETIHYADPDLAMPPKYKLEDTEIETLEEWIRLGAPDPRTGIALLQDLKDRDMLRDTLVLWGGEFGRSPQGQNNEGDGRRHNNRGYTMWMAGGGVKGGLRYGSTDETGGTAVEGKIDTHDLHATILHLLGLDHTRLTYRYAGRDFRLTDVYGEVAKEIIA
ncbi:MAG: DUF1501 domain-containing protein [Verrucomicrobiae bacterium]|nr:DUF1501 domain-containing protein [Verrucomicrobiae bacterium]